MAEPAQKEPTMEEILSSIRKIIADDDTGNVAEVSAQTETVSTTEDITFEDLELSVEDDPELVELTESLASDFSESVSDDIETDSFEDAVADPEIFSAHDNVSLEEEMFTAELESGPAEVFVAAPSEDLAETLDEFELPETEMLAVEETFDEPDTGDASLTDTKTVDAAAGSLGKLLSKVEFGIDSGSDNTVEGIVRDMLRPMLKEWLDDNLPGIVEKHVEQEVQRIARMAR